MFPDRIIGLSDISRHTYCQIIITANLKQTVDYTKCHEMLAFIDMIRPLHIYYFTSSMTCNALYKFSGARISFVNKFQGQTYHIPPLTMYSISFYCQGNLAHCIAECGFIMVHLEPVTSLFSRNSLQTDPIIYSAFCIYI
jgi:hypothetical protein